MRGRVSGLARMPQGVRSRGAGRLCSVSGPSWFLEPPRRVWGVCEFFRSRRRCHNKARVYCSKRCVWANPDYLQKRKLQAIMSGYGGRKDQNHNELSEILERHGVTMVDTSQLGKGFPDTLAFHRGELFLIEFKNPKTEYGKAGLNRRQLEWVAKIGSCSLYIVSTVNDAINFGSGRRSLVPSLTGDECSAKLLLLDAKPKKKRRSMDLEAE